MKEVQATPEKLIVIDIKLNRGLVVALSCVLVVAALLAFLTLTGGRASASETEAARAASFGTRRFYMSGGTQGDGVLGACVAGYHTASLWEIAEPSNLEYNRDLGSWRADSGQGPPVFWAWVRTGYTSGTSNVAGQANCAAWTSQDSADYGTIVSLPSEWTAGDEDMGVWSAQASYCSGYYHVWCIED